MSDTNEVVIPVAQPDAAQPTERTEPKFRKVIQPKDAEGNAVGNPSTFEAETQEELLDKMAESVANGSLKIRELTRKQTLEQNNFSVPDDAELYQEITEPQFKQLTPDQKFQLSMKLRDADTMEEAFDELYESRFGRKPADASKLQTQAARNSAAMREHTEANAFADEHPEFILNQQNAAAMLQYVDSRKLAKTKKNFERAFKELSDGGILSLRSSEEQTPTVQEVRNDPPTAAPVTRTPTAFPSAIKSGSGNGTASVKPKRPSAAEVAMMGPKQYKEYLAVYGDK